MPTNIVAFDQSAKEAIFDSFGFAVDSDGYIVEKKNPSQRVLTPDGDEIKADKFAGIKKGSIQFLRSDLPSLIELSDNLK